jgi:hypothetical protein
MSRVPGERGDSDGRWIDARTYYNNIMYGVLECA